MPTKTSFVANITGHKVDVEDYFDPDVISTIPFDLDVVIHHLFRWQMRTLGIISIDWEGIAVDGSVTSNSVDAVSRSLFARDVKVRISLHQARTNVNPYEMWLDGT